MLRAYDLPKETIIPIMKIYKNTKAMVRSHGFLQHRLHTKNLQRSNKRNGFTLKNISNQNPAVTIMNVDSVDDQAEARLHSLETSSEWLGIYVNANKTEFLTFKQAGAISVTLYAKCTVTSLHSTNSCLQRYSVQIVLLRHLKCQLDIVRKSSGASMCRGP